MEITYFKNQEPVAEEREFLVHSYWDLYVEQSCLTKRVTDIVNNNEELVCTYGSYTMVMFQRLGVKRLSIITKIIA